MAQPIFVAKGAFNSGIAALTVAMPAGLRNGDLLLLFIETANQAITTPAGWTQVTNSPQSTGTAATAGGVRLGVFYAIAAGAEASVTVADSGDHQTAIVMAYRNIDPAAPFNVTAGSVGAATTAMVFPTATTTVANTLIVLAAAMDIDSASTTTMGTITNANLTSITERHDQTVIAGTGGGLAITDGIKATAGATGTSSATGSTSTTHAFMTIALKGSIPTIRVVGQYRDDEDTVIEVGGYTTGDGITNYVGLMTEYATDSSDIVITPSSETEAIATSFDNVSNLTLHDLEQTDTSVWTSRRGANMVYDPDNKRYVFFGGYDGTSRYNEVWTQYTDFPGQPWRKLSPIGTPPNVKNLAGATLIRGNLTSGGALRTYMLVWGGVITTGSTETNEMHLLRLDTIGSEEWITVAQTSAPSTRSWINGNMTSTPVSGASNQNNVYLFGGWAATRENALYRCTIDVDTPVYTTWTVVTANLAAGSPPIRSGAVLASKPSTNKLYLYGGFDGTTYLNDFWEFDIAGTTWTNTSPTGTAPTGTEQLSGGYDSVNNCFWYAGGWTSTAQTTGRNNVGYINDVGGAESYVEVRANDTTNMAFLAHSNAAFCIDTDRRLLIIRSFMSLEGTEHYHYAIDLNDTSTSNMPVYGFAEGERLTARDAPSSVFNPVRNEWLVIGGFTGMNDDTTIVNGHHSSDIWVYSQSLNTWRYANKGVLTIPPLEGRVSCWDSTLGRVLVFGGLNDGNGLSNEVWQLVADDNGQYKATKLNPTGTPPSIRWLGIIAYDSGNNRMITGLGATTSSVLNDMYSLSFSGSADGAWTTLSPTGTPPAAVAQAAFFNKTSNTRLYVFGGSSTTALTTVNAQLLYFDYSTTNGAWTTPTSSGGTARRGAGFSLDVTNDTLIIFGGNNGTTPLTALQYFLLSGTTWTSATPTSMPDARRSVGSMFINSKFFVFGGRPTSGMWYNDTWQLTPNYGTPNSSTWLNKFPKTFTPMYFPKTGLTTAIGYHWQVWATESTVPSIKVSLGGSAQSVAHFIVSSGATLNFYPTTPMVAGYAQATVDGAFATMRDAAGDYATTAGSIYVELDASATTDVYTNFFRGLFSFDTSSLPAGAVVTDATIAISGTGISTTNALGTADLHIAGASGLSGTSISSSDYASIDRVSFGSITAADFFTTAGAYNIIGLNASGIANINVGGVSNFSAQLSWDILNNFTGTWASLAKTRFVLGGAPDASPPKLMVYYTMSATPTNLFFQMF